MSLRRSTRSTTTPTIGRRWPWGETGRSSSGHGRRRAGQIRQQREHRDQLNQSPSCDTACPRKSSRKLRLSRRIAVCELTGVASCAARDPPVSGKPRDEGRARQHVGHPCRTAAAMVSASTCDFKTDRGESRPGWSAFMAAIVPMGSVRVVQVEDDQRRRLAAHLLGALLRRPRDGHCRAGMLRDRTDLRREQEGRPGLLESLRDHSRDQGRRPLPQERLRRRLRTFTPGGRVDRSGRRSARSAQFISRGISIAHHPARTHVDHVTGVGAWRCLNAPVHLPRRSVSLSRPSHRGASSGLDVDPDLPAIGNTTDRTKIPLRRYEVRVHHTRTLSRRRVPRLAVPGERAWTCSSATRSLPAASVRPTCPVATTRR